MRQVCLFLIQLFLTFILVGCEYVGAVSKYTVFSGFVFFEKLVIKKVNALTCL